MLNEISDLNVLRVAVMGKGVEEKDRSNESANHSGSIEVSIVMPCLNEAETLEGCIEEAQAAIRATCVRGEVVVADNGSTDGSQALATRAGARVIQVGTKGYGSALLGGIRAARGLYVLIGDADGSYDFGELPKFLECLRAGKDLVMGCRLPKGGGKIEIGAMPWKHRWIGNPALSGIGKIMFQAPIDDFHCGLRAFKRQAVLDLDLRCTGMEFASEMIVKGVVAKLAFDQVPITLRPDGRSRPPHLRSWRDGWRHLRFMLLFAPKWLFFIPGATLFSLGTIGFISLMFGPIRVGIVIFDTNTLLICTAAMLVGFQLLFFAVFVKAFAVRANLLQPDPRIDKILKAGPADWGGIVGMLLCVVGIGYLIMAIGFWQGKGFGPLPYAEGLRIVIPGVTAISLGAQCIFSGFALAIIDLPRRES